MARRTGADARQETSRTATHPAQAKLPKRPQPGEDRTHRSAGYLSNKHHGVCGLCQGIAALLPVVLPQPVGKLLHHIHPLLP
jgi:tetrahydromethanopterin S-methyltransferase subunit B